MHVQQTQIEMEIEGGGFIRPFSNVTGESTPFEVGQIWVTWEWPLQHGNPQEDVGVAIGKKVEFRVRQGTKAEREATYHGRVVRVISSPTSLSMQIAGPLHALEGARKSRGFANMNDLGIVRTVLEGAGVSHHLAVDAEPEEQPLIRRLDETEREFVCRIGNRNGWVIFERDEGIEIASRVEGKAIILTDQDLPEGPGTIDISVDVIPMASSVQQFDPLETSRVLHKELPGSGSLIDLVRGGSRSVFGDSCHDLHQDGAIVPKTLDAELRARAKSLGANLACYRARTSHPGIRVGSIIRHHDRDFLSDDLVVVSVVFSYSTGGRYLADITAVPLELLSGPPLGEAPRERGLALAEVVDDCDEENLGRVQVRFHDDPNTCFWARVAVKAAGAKHWEHWTPRIGSQVVMGFLDGLPCHPVVLGCLFHTDASPDFETPNGAEEVAIVHTERGSTIQVREDGPRESIRIHQGSSNDISLTTDDSGSAIEINTVGRLVVKAKEVVFESDILDVVVKQEARVEAGSFEVEGESVKIAASEGEFTASNRLKFDSTIMELG